LRDSSSRIGSQLATIRHQLREFFYRRRREFRKLHFQMIDDNPLEAGSMELEINPRTIDQILILDCTGRMVSGEGLHSVKEAVKQLFRRQMQ
jgi:hypothetical protein